MLANNHHHDTGTDRFCQCVQTVVDAVIFTIIIVSVFEENNNVALFTQRRVQPDQCYFTVQITGSNFECSL